MAFTSDDYFKQKAEREAAQKATREKNAALKEQVNISNQVVNRDGSMTTIPSKPRTTTPTTNKEEPVFTKTTLEQIQNPKSYYISPQEKIQTIEREGKVVGYTDPLTKVSTAAKKGYTYNESSIREAELQRQKNMDISMQEARKKAIEESKPLQLIDKRRVMSLPKPQAAQDTILGIWTIPKYEYSAKEKPYIPALAALMPTFIPSAILYSKEFRQPLTETRTFFQEKAETARIKAVREGSFLLSEGDFGLTFKEFAYQVPTQTLSFIEKPTETITTVLALGATGGESLGLKGIAKGSVQAAIPQLVIGQTITEFKEGQTGGATAAQLAVFGSLGLADYKIQKAGIKEPSLDYGTFQKGEVKIKQFNEKIIQSESKLSPKKTTGKGIIEGQPAKLSSVSFIREGKPIEATKITFEGGERIQTQKYQDFTVGERYNPAGKKTGDIFYYNELPKVTEANIKQTNIGGKRDILSWIRKEPEDFSGSLVRGSQDIRFVEQGRTKLEVKSVLNNIPQSETTISQMNRNARFEIVDYFKGKKVTDINPMFEEVKSSQAGFIQPKVDFKKQFELVKGKYTIKEKGEVVTSNLREKINIGREEKIDIINIGRGRIGKPTPAEKPVDITSSGRFQDLQSVIIKENIKNKNLFEQRSAKAESQNIRLKTEQKAEVIGLKAGEFESMFKPSTSSVTLPKTITKTSIIPVTTFKPTQSIQIRESKNQFQPIIESRAAQKANQPLKIQPISDISQNIRQSIKPQQINIQETRQGIKVKQDINIEPIPYIGQKAKPIIPIEEIPVGFDRGGGISPPFVLPPPIGMDLNLGGKSKSVRGSQPKYGYLPSIEAEIFNIKGKRGRGWQSGLTMRPL